MKPSLGDVIRRAGTGDIAAVKATADFCRFRLGLNYQQTLDLVRKVLPEMDEAKWDNLLYQVDEMESDCG